MLMKMVDLIDSRFDRSLLRRSIVMAICLTCGGGVARADLQILTLQAPLNIAGPTSSSLSMGLPQFDPTLGTLTSVVVSTQTVAEFAYEIHDDYGDPGSGQVYFTAGSGTIGPGLNIEDLLQTPTESISLGVDGDYYSPTYMLESDRAYAVTSSYLSQYIGTGSNFIELYAAPTPSDLSTPGFNFIGNFVAPAGQLMVGDVTITATFMHAFTPSVPEPSSFVLTSLGAVGLGFLFQGSCRFSRKKRI